MTSSATFAHMLTCFFLLLALAAMGIASPRPQFGDGNQEDWDEYEEMGNVYDTYNLKADNRVDASDIYNEDIEREDPEIPSSSTFYRPLPDYYDYLPEDMLLQRLYKRVGNTRYPSQSKADGVHRRNGIDKKIKTRPNGFTPIRCLVNPVTCFK